MSPLIPLQAGPGYIPGFDGLRAIAVSIVLVAHLGFDLFVPGGFGVTIFFFLSGFLITRLLLGEQEARGAIGLAGFWMRRLLRLGPALVVFVAVSGLALWAWGQPPSPAQVLAALTWTVNYWGLTSSQLGPPAISPDELAPWGHLWSLAVEEHFYLLFPLLLMAFGRTHRGRLVLVWTMIVACALWRFLVVHALDLPLHWPMFATDSRLESIAWGCLLAVLLDGAGRGLAVTSGPLSRDGAQIGGLVSPHWAGIAILVLGFSLLFRETEYRMTWRYSMQGAALLVLVLNLYALASLRPLVALLETAPMRWTGRLSYGLYLWHMPVFWWLAQLEGPGPLSAGACAIGLAIAWALALTSWRFVERPTWALRARWGGRPVETMARPRLSVGLA